MRKWILFMLLTTGSAHAGGNVPFDIQGMSIGDKLTKKFAYNHCPYKAVEAGDKDIDCFNQIDEDADISAVYMFRDKRLHNVSIGFPSGKYEAMVNAYTEKFQQSPDVSKFIMKNNFGMSLVVPIAAWETNTGIFKIQKHINLNRGVATFDIADPKTVSQDKALKGKL